MSNDSLKLTIATGKSRKETYWENKQYTWGHLVELLSNTRRTNETEAEYAAMTKDERQAQKDIGGFVGGEIINNSRKKDNVRSRQILSLDMDYGSPGNEEDYALMFDWECLVHTTHSHTREHPRFRMFFPLSRPAMPDEYEAIGRMVAKQIGIELFDDSTYEVSRLMFWPSTPKDGEFICWRHKGTLINPDEILGWYADWHDQREWPTSERTKREIHQSAERQQSPYKNKNPIIRSFAWTYDIPGAIDKYLPGVYVPVEKDPKRYTYTGGTTTAGLRLYGDNDKPKSPPWCFCYSEHDSDPAKRQNLNAFDLVRVHKFPDLDSKAGYEAMKELMKTDEAWRTEWERQISMTPTEFKTDNRDDTLKRQDEDYNELGNAIKLKDACQSIMCYHASTDWCVWNGSMWEQNARRLALLLVMNQTDRLREHAQRMLQLAPEPEDKRKRSTWSEEYERARNALAWAERSRGYNNLSNTLKAAESLMAIREADDFDRDPWKLNTPDGIVDLKTSEIGECRAEEMCTMCTLVTPDFNGPRTMWDEFLNRVTGGDADFQRYLQEVAGMALVGKVYEEGLVIVYGSGGNGKSTLFSVWQTLMGSYSETVRNEVLMGNKNGSEVSGQNLLRGKRLVITSELEESQVMQNSLLKRLTSRDKISANVKYHEPITFTPSHTLILHTNHLPRLRSVDGGTVRRIAVAPFETVIKTEERISDYAGLLVEKEGPQILAWMCEGAKRFWDSHMTLRKPPVVQKATDDYINGEDLIQQFLDEACEADPKGIVSMPELKREFSKWADIYGMPDRYSPKQFTNEIEQHGFKTRVGRGRRREVLGIRTIPEDFADLGEDGEVLH